VKSEMRGSSERIFLANGPQKPQEHPTDDVRRLGTARHVIGVASGQKELAAGLASKLNSAGCRGLNASL